MRRAAATGPLRRVRKWEVLQRTAQGVRGSGRNHHPLSRVLALQFLDLPEVRGQLLPNRRQLRVSEHHRQLPQIRLVQQLPG